jgi:hypothetical protein
MRKKLIIEKQSTCQTTTTQNTTTTQDTTTDDTTSTITNTLTETQPPLYQSLADSNYKVPRGGTIQDNMTIDDIKTRLKGCVALKTMADKQALETLPLYKTWIKYINIRTRKFRTGGFLMKSSYPDYIMLVNIKQNLVWSVQLKDNIIYIRDPEIVQAEKKESMKERKIKEKLYDMYKQGRLRAA